MSDDRKQFLAHIAATRLQVLMLPAWARGAMRMDTATLAGVRVNVRPRSTLWRDHEGIWHSHDPHARWHPLPTLAIEAMRIVGGTR